MVVKRANASETLKSLSISQSSQTRLRSRRIFHVCCQSAVVLQIRPCSHWSRFWKLDRSEIDLARNFSFCLIWILETGQLTGLLIFRAVAEPRNSGKSAKSREIHKNTKNTAKFGRNLIKYMSVQHIWNLFQLLGLFTCRKLTNLSWNFVTEMCKQRPETTRGRLCCEKLGTSHDVKGFAIGSFLERIVVERVNDDLC